MAKVTMTKIRTFLASLFAIALVLILFSALAAYSGKRLPVLSAISDWMGIR